MSKSRKGWIIALAIIILFVVTNPNPRAFKDYLGYPSTSTVQRIYNCGIFSVYKIPEGHADGGRIYFGIFMNFFDINSN